MFTALNASSSDEDGPSLKENTAPAHSRFEENDRKEETRVFAVYKSVLEKLALKRIQEAKADLLSLLGNKILKNIQDQNSNQLRQLYYAVLKNLGSIAATEKDCNQAVVYYKQALALYNTDVSLWYDFGAEAFKSGDILLARDAFEAGLSLSPENFMCLDKLMVAYFILGDFPNCLNKVRQALIKQPCHERSLILKHVIFERYPYLKAGYSNLFDDLDTKATYSEESYNKMVAKFDEITEKFYASSLSSNEIDPYCPKTNVMVKPLSWSSIIQALLALKLELEENEISLVHPINFLLSDGQREDGVLDCDDSLDIMMKENATDSDSLGVASSNPVNYDSLNEMSSDPKVMKNRKRKAAGLSNANDDLIEAKRRSSRLIPGFFIEDPEAFGPLTTRPINIKEQLISFLPDEIRDYCPSKIRRMIVSDNKTNTKSSDFDDCSRLIEDPIEIEQFITENNNQSFLAIATQILIRFTKPDAVHSIWPKTLVNEFVKLFSVWHENQISDDDDELLCNSTLFALELSLISDILPRKLHLIHHLDYYCHRLDLNVDKNVDFALRFNYFSYKTAEIAKKFDRAYFHLSNCQNLAFYKSEHFQISLPNSGDIISTPKILYRLDLCRRTKSLAAIEASFNQKDYRFVIDHAKLSDDECERLDESLEEKCERLKFLCRSYEKLEVFDGNMFVSLVDLLWTLLQRYRNANFDDMTSFFGEFAENLGLIKRCIAKNTNLLKIGSSRVSDLSIGCLAETVVELVLIFIDFSDNTERFSTSKSRKIQNDNVIPESCWFDAFEILYDLSKSYELERMLEDEQYAKNWWTSRKIVDNSSSGYSFLILVTKSFMIFNFAHEELGKRRMCTKDGGFFLTKFASELRSILRIPKISKNMPSGVSDDTLNCAEQCFYCLYNYPRKRSRCLSEHSAENTPLTWPAAFLLFDFVRPEKSPEFDDSPYNSSVSSETVVLLHRIEDLVPGQLKPEPHLPSLIDYIEGKSTTFIPDKIYSSGTCSRNTNVNENSSSDNELTIVWDLYHLIADYYAKNKDKDIDKICRYYQLDLCISNDRSDSWAGLALFKQAVVDQFLSSLELKYSEECVDQIIEAGRSTLFCFQKAIDFNAYHIVLLVENGSLAYTMHSFLNRACRRVKIKVFQKSNAKLSIERRAVLNSKKLEYLHIARQCFEKGEQLLKMTNSHDFYDKDSWLVYYMLGKIKEECIENSPPSRFLPYYHRAAHLLHVEGAKYPAKIPYSAPKYAYEALEVYFRVYASSLKWLLRNDNPAEAELRIINKYFKLFAQHPIRSRKSSHVFECDPDVVDCVTDMMDNMESISLPSKRRLMYQSAEVMKILCRKSVHPYYKAYYWLVRFYKSSKELKMCRFLLLGAEQTNVSVPSLFNFKTPQLFEGIWVIPADDISRSGSFAEYLFKILSILQQVLAESDDIERLSNLCIMLLRKPNQKSQYLRECDRQELSQLYFLNCEQSIVKSFAKSATKEIKARICLQAYSIYQQVERLKYEKHAAHFFEKVLKQCFAMIVGAQELKDVPKDRVLKFYCDLRGMSERQVRSPIFTAKSSQHQPRINVSNASTTMARSITPSTISTAKVTVPPPISTPKILPVNSSNVICSPSKTVQPSAPKSSPEISIVKHSVDKILTVNKPPVVQQVKSSAARDGQINSTSSDNRKAINTKQNPLVAANKTENSRNDSYPLPLIRTASSTGNSNLQVPKRKIEQSSTKSRPKAQSLSNVISSFQQNLLRQNSIESILKSAMAGAPTSQPDSPSTSFNANLLANLKSSTPDINATFQLLNRLPPQQQLHYLKIAAQRVALQKASTTMPAQSGSRALSAPTTSQNQVSSAAAPRNLQPSLGCDKTKFGSQSKQ